MNFTLPSHDGLLPYWLLLTSTVSVINTVQCYRNNINALRTYDGPLSASQVSDFSARMFGTWTFLSCVIRLYAAYRIETWEVYALAMWTYVIALGHFGGEWLGYGTMKAGKGLASVLVVAAVSVSWMFFQWDFYVRLINVEFAALLKRREWKVVT